jgi:hypothetical protein
MIPGSELAAWLADNAAQERSFARVEACARKWSIHPLLTDLERAIIALPARTPEALLAAARRFLDRTDDIDAMLREMIALSRLDPFFRPPLQPISNEIHHSLLLYHHPDLSIGLGVTGIDLLAAKKTARRGPASVNFTGYTMLMRFVDAGDAVFSFWEAPPITDAFTAADAGSCRMIGRRAIESGEDVVVDGRHQSFSIDHAERDIVYFQAVIRGGSAPVSAEYDVDTEGFIGASSTDEASSRLQMMVSLLRAMGRDEAFPLFEAALAGSQFHTRWHIMREMLAMDAEAALPALRDMAARDPNPDVRHAAGQTLDMFFAEPAAAAERGAA